jgi:rod shape-determining protein MreB
LFANRTGLVVKIAEDPLTCVARGTADYLENLEQYKAILESNVEEL